MASGLGQAAVDGQLAGGERTINAAEAAIVRRIFADDRAFLVHAAAVVCSRALSPKFREAL
ncbi:hypothetical protein [Bradyrhizobium betae]|nr:hypothetical protein [Bradyrhizobium betae]